MGLARDLRGDGDNIRGQCGGSSLVWHGGGEGARKPGPVRSGTPGVAAFIRGRLVAIRATAPCPWQAVVAFCGSRWGYARDDRARDVEVRGMEKRGRGPIRRRSGGSTRKCTFAKTKSWTMRRRRCCSPRQIGLAAKRGLAPASLTSSFVSRNTLWVVGMLESEELSCASDESRGKEGERGREKAGAGGDLDLGSREGSELRGNSGSGVGGPPPLVQRSLP